MLPVASTLLWLYWYFLPVDIHSNRRWRWVDSGLLAGLIVLACIFVYTKMHAEYIDVGPIWAEVVAVTGAYLIIATGLLVGLIARRKFAKSS